MGGGIWSMHFIGMLAYSMHMPVRYHFDLTLYSLLIAIMGSGVGLYFGTRARQGKSYTLILSGLFMGLAIASMHYIGMEAMDMAAEIVYDPWLIAVSIAIAITASTAAIYLVFYLRKPQQNTFKGIKTAASVVMGFAISGMHYTGMAAASFMPTNIEMHSTDLIDTTTLVAAITIITILIQGFALIALIMDNQIKTEHRYRIISNHILDGLITIDRNGIVEEFNRAAQDIFGYEPIEVIGRNIKMLMPDPYQRDHDQYMHNYMSSGIKKIIGIGREVIGLRKDGSTFPMDLAVTKMLVGEELTFVGLIRDITERKTHEEKHDKRNMEVARATTRALSIFHENAHHHFIFIEMLEQVLSLTQSNYGLIGAVLHAKDGTPYLKTYATNNLAWENEAIEIAQVGETNLPGEEDLTTLYKQVVETGEIVIKNLPTNDIEADDHSITPTYRPELTAFLGIPLTISGKMIGIVGVANRPGGYDPTSLNMLEGILHSCASIIVAYHNNNLRIKAEEDVKKLAHFDSLTDLPNRSLFMDRLVQSISQAKRNKTTLTLFFLDLDGFKSINDTAGHKAGDQVLKLVADRLKACVREMDTVARLGGDEFTLILPGTEDDKQAAVVAKKVIATIGDVITLDGTAHQIGASIGIAIYPEDGEGVEALLNNADKAMYAAKAAGKNRYIFYKD